MAKTLADKIKESRLSEVKIGEITFKIRRATSEEMFTYYAATPGNPNGMAYAEVARRHVVGWSGVKESDVLEGGSADIIPFEKDIFDLVIGDNQEWWTYIANEVLMSATDRLAKKAEAKKK